jgi:glycosyltransferase involved in cell wall biosynthesis
MELRQPTHLIVFEEKGRLTSLSGRFVIHELGWLTDAGAMVEAMTAADLFLMPSVAESAGLMALEAMACGTPVIVSNASAQPEMVREPTAGLAVPVGDAAALAAAIETLLADDARRAAMGEAGRRIVETEHAYDLYVRRHLELYQDVVARGARERQG